MLGARSFLIATFLLIGGIARAQELAAPIIVRPASSGKLPAPVSEFTNIPPDIILIPDREGARQGRIWVRTEGEGLLIAGKVEGEPPDFPQAKNEMLLKDHVEIWLAGAPDVEMPQLGWADYFGGTYLPKGSRSCADFEWPPQEQSEAEKKCRDWADQQLNYRRYLKRLFVRQWLVAPGFYTESFATPAYRELLTKFGGAREIYVNDGPRLLEPRGQVRTWMFSDGSGYSFQIFVPFTALPPLSSLKISELYLLVDVFGPAPSGKKTGAYSSSSSARVYGEPKTFNRVRLDEPVSYRLTPCNLPLLGMDMEQELSEQRPTHPAWFVPSSKSASSYEAETFALMNDIVPSREGPGGPSPGIRLTHYFWNRVGPEEWVCGPPLSHQIHGESESFPYVVSRDGFEAKRLPDGDLLIKNGPRVYNWASNAQCGACPRTELAIYDLGKDRKIFEALRLDGIVDGTQFISQDFTLSPDWSRVTEYDQAADENDEAGFWSSTTYCLKMDEEKYETSAPIYKPCGQRKNVQPPNPPVLKQLRQLLN